MSKKMKMTHPNIKDSEVIVLVSAFEKVWKAKGWKKVSESKDSAK